MKKKFNILYKILFISLISSVCYAQKPNLQEKIINKNYDNIDGSSIIEIENKFGDILLETSESQKTVEVEIKIQSWHSNINKAKDLLNQISISDNSSENNIDLETQVPSNTNINDKKGFTIIYTVKSPVDINLNLDNKYGSISLESINGNTEIEVGYGSFKAKDLNGSSNEIEIKYGSGDIDFIEKGEIYSRYLGGLSIGQANDLTIDDKYGNISIGTAGKIEGENAYSNLNINTLRGDIEFESDYGSIKISEINKSFQSINLETSYGSIKIGFENDTAFDFESEVKYGSFKHNIDGLELMKEIEHNTSAEYEGYRFEKGSGRKIFVKASYGSIKFN